MYTKNDTMYFYYSVAFLMDYVSLFKQKMIIAPVYVKKDTYSQSTYTLDVLALGICEIHQLHRFFIPGGCC